MIQKKEETKQDETYDYYDDYYGHAAFKGKIVSENGKYGYTNKTGELLTPVKYDLACDFLENIEQLLKGRGLAKVQLNGKWGCINKDGKEIVPLKYDEIEIDGPHEIGIDQSYYKDDPYIAACIDKKWGFVDEAGTEIIPLEYDSVCPFQSHRARVEKNGKYGYINNKGVLVIPIIYDDCEPKLIEFTDNDNKHYLIPCLAMLDDKYGYIDINGNRVIKFRYEYATPFHFYYKGVDRDITAAVVLNGKVGFIDGTGKEMIPFIYEPLNDPVDYCDNYSFYDGFANVKRYGKWGVIDINNKVVIPFLYDKFLYPLLNIGWRCAIRNRKRLTIDTKGHERLVKKNPHARTFKDCLSTVTLEEVVEKGCSLFNLSDQEVEGLKAGFSKFSSVQPRPSKSFMRLYIDYDSRTGIRWCSTTGSYLLSPLEEVLDMEVRIEDDLVLSDAEIVVHCIRKACDDVLTDQKMRCVYSETENENRAE
jgi:hypothetical protein